MPIRKAFVVFGIFLLGFFLLYLAISPDRLGRILTYIKDPLIYYYGFLLTFPLLLIAYFAKQNNKIVPYSVFLLSLFLASASSGRDYATVIMVFPLVILLCLELIRITGRKYLVLVIIVYSLIPYIFFGQLLKSLSSLMNYKQLQLLQFEGIYLPPKTADEILSIVKFVQKKTNQNDTILCFPYCPLLNVLTQRKSGSYFSFFYPETIRAKDQKRVIDDLKKNQTKIIIVQKPGEIEKEALYENNRLSLLRNYFLSNYNPVFSSQNFVIYQINNSNKKLSP